MQKFDFLKCFTIFHDRTNKAARKFPEAIITPEDFHLLLKPLLKNHFFVFSIKTHLIVDE